MKISPGSNNTLPLPGLVVVTDSPETRPNTFCECPNPLRERTRVTTHNCQPECRSERDIWSDNLFVDAWELALLGSRKQGLRTERWGERWPDRQTAQHASTHWRGSTWSTNCAAELKLNVFFYIMQRNSSNHSRASRVWWHTNDRTRTSSSDPEQKHGVETNTFANFLPQFSMLVCLWCDQCPASFLSFWNSRLNGRIQNLCWLKFQWSALSRFSNEEVA